MTQALSEPSAGCLRLALPEDLDEINSVIAASIGTWGLPPRVRELSAPLYRVSAHDLGVGRWWVATEADASSPGRRIVAVADWSPAGPTDSPSPDDPAALLNGLYVVPDKQRSGLGARLLRQVCEDAQRAGFAVLSTRAQRSAEGFFLRRGFRPFGEEGGEPLYPRRLWRRGPAGSGDAR